MRRSPAFTLVELLIVIAVIAVLVSIMLPMVNKIQMGASQVSCLSNMRQLTSAIMTYAADNQNQLPYCNWNNSVDDNSQYCKGWLFSTSQYRVNYTPPILNGAWGGLAHFPIEGPMTGVIWPYTQSLKPYHCPVDNPDFWTGTEWLTSYLFNGSECGYGGMGYASPGVQFTRVKNSRTQVMLWEALEQRFENQQYTGAIWNDGSSWPGEEVLADRHYHGANISFYDGHVEWWNPTAWSTWLAKGQFSLY